MNWTRVTIIVFVLSFHLISTNGSYLVPNMPRKQYVQEGDVMLGGLFPIYLYDGEQPCGSALRAPVIVQYVEAMVYAVEQINERTRLLPNVTLGYAIVDTCVKESTALIQALHFVPRCDVDCARDCYQNQTMSITHQPHFDVVGVVGAMKSTCSVEVAHLLGPFKLPIISYSSTSDTLSNKALFPSFMRLVPPDKFQCEAMIDFIRHHGWTYISMVYSDDTYGLDGARHLMRLINKHQICVGESLPISETTSDEKFDKTVQKLVVKSNARVVIVFAGPAPAKGLLEAVKRANVTGTFVWIFSDAIATQMSQLSDLYPIFVGAFTFKFYSQPIKEFDDYFKTLNPDNKMKNPWFLEYWEKTFGCRWSNTSVGDDIQLCDRNDVIGEKNGHEMSDSIAPVIDTVFTFALAIRRLIKSHCSTFKAHELNKCVKGPKLLEYLMSVKFQGHLGYIQFNEEGDILGCYKITQVQYAHTKYEQVHIAVWNATNHTLTFKNISIKWGGDGVTSPPESECSRACQSGQYYHYTDMNCCWECRQCRSNEIVTSNGTNCEACPKYSWPDDQFHSCEAIEESYIKWTDPLAIILSVVSVSGMAITCIMIAFFVINKNERLIKASSRELCFLMLVGIFIGYLTVMGLVAPPQTDMCYVVYFGFALGFTWIYGPLLTRTNRIYRIFQSGKKSTKRPMFVSPRSQLVFAILLIGIQVRTQELTMVYRITFKGENPDLSYSRIE